MELSVSKFPLPTLAPCLQIFIVMVVNLVFAIIAIVISVSVIIL